ncbi:hypothetical protein K443DRAFT_628329 [Laccaria amethystina LaAM-08-1]|uniref:Uncharacterized protein n=1 Tax=Laccaria amethystina LaAM-08-1 TaxID=1095629 RepID=A0A0C9X9Y2_9AGAR|nr:hypothetical protein K443DRAFT_628329 [Laccaria amethystina LaAM-08-1]
MGYGMYFPAHQVGGQPELWGIRSYGVSGVWVKRSSTVLHRECRSWWAQRWICKESACTSV